MFSAANAAWGRHSLNQDCQPSTAWQGKMSLNDCVDLCDNGGFTWTIHPPDNNCKCSKQCTQYTESYGWEIWVNKKSTEPSSSPTIAPSPWYENPIHATTLVELQKRMTAVERADKSFAKEIVDMKAEIMDELKGDVLQLSLNIIAIRERLDMAEGNQSMLATSLSDLSEMGANGASATTAMGKRLDSIEGLFNKLQSALKSAASAPTIPSNSCVGSDCIPTVGSDGNDIVLTASTVTLKANQCAAADLCEVTTFSEQLRSALQSL